jgi:two-component sensor histidine kinase
VSARDKLVERLLPPSDHVQETVSLRIEPVPRAVGDARRFVAAHAPELPPETRDSLLLLTSELVTNAVLHARTEIEVGVVVADESVMVLVHDRDLTMPNQDPYASREGGWGLGLVKALSQDAALCRHPEGGKTAWFRLSRRYGAPSIADGAAARAEGRDS